VSVPSRQDRLGGLDGLRAVAVAAVVLFHVDSDLVPGGFLGVDVFFVISGFVITRLLLDELSRTGGLRLVQFYRNRARRLFPSVAALIVVVSLASVLVWRDELATLRASVLSSVGYATNWYLIFDHQSYFVSSGRPPMLQHLWSLAVEEQYYLLWPLGIMVLTGAARKLPNPERHFAVVVRVAVLLAVASTVAMAVIAVRTDVPYASDSARVYFGTDTHSMGLFLGSAAGAWNVMHADRLLRSRVAFLWLSDLLAIVGLGLLGWEFLHLDEFRPALYRGGFLVLDLIALVVVCAVARRGSAIGWLLDLGVMRWIGRRSYAIYLWHWPVAVVTRPGIDVHGPLLLVNLGRLALMLALAEVSYRYVECPLRAARWRMPSLQASRLVIRMPLIGALACLAVVWMAARPDVTKATAPVAQRVVVVSTSSVVASSSPSADPTPTLDPTQTLTASDSPTPTASTSTTAPPPPPPPVPIPVSGMSAFGDSVLLGAEPALQRLDPKVDVDAVEGRQANLVLNDIVTRHQRNQLGPVVVIHTGNNGIINPSQLTSVLSMLAGCRRVVVLTDRVPRDWQAPNNATLTSVTGQFPNVRLIDWNSLSATHPDWFYTDGLHLRPPGAAAYAQLIMAAAQT
jgi:peptidoglycan/LPS O-acetylase OafA/YrhL